jgi:rod shape-determining protein MreB and related proteins
VNEYPLAMIFRRTLYCQFSDTIACLRDLQRGDEVRLTPEVAIQRSGTMRRVAAVGETARSCVDSQVVNPFAHPRLVMVEHEVAEALLRYLLKHLLKRKIMFKPRLILHPLRRFEPDLTDVEIRALLDSAIAVGAACATVYRGPELSVGDLDSKQFEWTAPRGP